MESRDDSTESVESESSGAPLRPDDSSAHGQPEHWRDVAAAVAELTPCPVVVFDDEHKVMLGNAAFVRLVGLDDRQPLLGVPLAELISMNAESIVAGSGAAIDVQTRSDGRAVPARFERVQTAAARFSVLRFDIDGAPENGSNLSPELASPPRPYLTDRAEFAAAIERNLADPSTHECGLLLVDVERLETITDALGTADSDLLFIALVERLRAAVRHEFVACRFAGDEIAILTMVNMDRVKLADMARSVITAIQEPFLVDQQPVTIRASVGVAVGGEHSNVESMLREADVALSQARAHGMGLAVFDERLREHLAEMSRFEGELRLALAAGRMELFYQPEVDLQTGRAVGVEALVRWPHPVLGVVPADRFVEITEDTGMSAELGRWVLAEACATLADWIETPDLSMKVNVSVGQLASRDLAGEVAAVLIHTGIEPAKLCLEITETSVMTDLDRSLAVLGQLTDLGVKLAIDDFGTGFSSLAYLKDLPVDILKIDRILVADVAVDDAARAILSGILGMARSLGLEVVAEGVETEAQRRELLALGCRRAQGHLFSNPLDRESAEAWLRA